MDRPSLRREPTVRLNSPKGCGLLAALAFGLLLAWQATAQTGGWRIETFAGGGAGDGGPATAVRLSDPFGVAVDASGNVYIAEWGNDRIRRIDAKTGIIETVAGTGTPGYGGDGGPATAAPLSSPVDVAVDASGHVYVADAYNNRVRRIDAETGTIETVAGTGTPGYGGDGGPATAAWLSSPSGVAVDASGHLYVSDWGNNRVRRIDAETGAIETVAGTGAPGYGGDGGPATTAQLSPFKVAVDASGHVYVTDTDNNRVRRIDAETGAIETVAGTGTSGYGGDGGPATAARLSSPSGVAVDASGHVYVSELGNERVRRIDAKTGAVETIAGTGEEGYGGDGGPATAAQLSPFDVAVDASGHVYVTDTDNHRVRRIDADTGAIETIAGGTGNYGGDGGPATAARLSSPFGVAVDASGHVYVSDWGNERVRRIDAKTGTIETVAGTGTPGYGGDGGPATAARLFHPVGVAVDVSGHVYVADADNHRVRRIDAETGAIETVAGTGERGYGGDGGPATAARLSDPFDVAVDASGNVYVSDWNNERVRRIDAKTGAIETVAGTGALGDGGDGGPATAARLSSPSGVAVDASGNVYVADADNHRIRRIDAQTGVVRTVAGTGEPGYDGDGGPATAARLSSPSDVAVDASGNVYVADWGNHRLRRVDAETGTVWTVAGTGEPGYGGDGGPATAARLFHPVGVAVGASGHIYVADRDNHRIRRIDAKTGVDTP